MPLIHFIGGEKGGVGKSVVSRLLAQYYIDRKRPFSAFDADLSHGAMLRYYADFTTAIDPTDFESLDQLAESAVESGNDAIVDLAAQTARPINAWMEASGFPEMGKELGLEVVLWHVMDDGYDSQRLLGETLKKHAKNFRYVVVRNHGRGADFEPFNKSGECKWAQRFGAEFIDLPALTPSTMSKIDRRSASFWAAVNGLNNEGKALLSLMERQRVKTWITQVYQAFDQLLAPKAEPKQEKPRKPDSPTHPGYY